MRAAKTSTGHLTLISSTYSKVFDKIKIARVIYENELSERDIEIAKQLVQLNLVTTTHIGKNIGYKAVPQQDIF